MIKKILVSQPKPSSEKSPYFDIANRFGVELVFRPFIKVEAITSKDFRAQKVSILDYTAIVFTSRHAIDHFFNMAKELRVTIPEDMKYFCVTETIALYIQKYVQYRKRKVFFGETGRIDDLVPTMVKHKTEKYLVPMSDVHNDSLSNLLDSKKLTHRECVMYKTVSNDFSEEEVKNFDYDMLIFFSPAGIESLTKNFPNFKQGKIAIATFGPTTAKAAKEAGLRLDIEAPSEKYPSMTGALQHYLIEKQAPTFSKKERIVSKKLMETLFEKGDSQAVTAFPLKAVYMSIDRPQGGAPAQVLISVPKKRFKHAVDRNRVKRQVREAFRHHKETIYGHMATDRQLLVAFIWLSDRHYVSAEVEQRVSKILQKIARQL